MQGFWENALYTSHVGQGSGSGLSPRLWSNLRSEDMTPDGGLRGYSLMEDFLNFSPVAYNINAEQRYGESGAWCVFTHNTSGCTMTNYADATNTNLGGVYRMSLPATDNTTCVMQACGGTGAFATIDDHGGYGRKLIYETRVRFNGVTGTGVQTYEGAFLGLASPGLTVTGALVDATLIPIATSAFSGFTLCVVGTGAAYLKFTYQQGSATSQNSAALTLNSTATPTVLEAGAVCADASTYLGTWHKLGFIYDPASDPSKRIRVFVDNKEQVTAAGTNIPALPIAHSKIYTDGTGAVSTFPTTVYPGGTLLTPLIAYKNHTTAAKTLDIDWVAAYATGP